MLSQEFVLDCHVFIGLFYLNFFFNESNGYMLDSRDGNFAPPLPASLRADFSRPAKVMGQDFKPAPRGGAGRGWVYTF